MNRRTFFGIILSALAFWKLPKAKPKPRYIAAVDFGFSPDPHPLFYSYEQMEDGRCRLILKRDVHGNPIA